MNGDAMATPFTPGNVGPRIRRVRLRIPGVHLRGRSRGENVNDVLRLGRKIDAALTCAVFCTMAASAFSESRLARPEQAVAHTAPGGIDGEKSCLMVSKPVVATAISCRGSQTMASHPELVTNTRLAWFN